MVLRSGATRYTYILETAVSNSIIVSNVAVTLARYKCVGVRCNTSLKRLRIIGSSQVNGMSNGY